MRLPHSTLFSRLLTPLFLTIVLAFAVAWSSPANSDPTPGPALWKVEGGKAELYILGTFHLLPADLEWRNAIISGALARTDTLVLEADTSDDAATDALIEAYAFNPAGKTLRSYFTDEEVELIDAALKPWGMSVDSAAALRPWFVSLQAGLTAMLSLGFEPDSGVEQILLAVASQNAMTLDYLESSEAGIRALADHPDDVQTKILLASIEDLGRIEEMMEEMIKAWSQGDIDTVAELLNSSMSRTPELLEAVLYDRNRDWISKLERMLESEGVYFVAVGAGHLAGDNSVIELLEADGYRLVRQ